MATRTAGIGRFGRARRRVHSILPVHFLLILPAVYFLLSGRYSYGLPTFYELVALLSLGSSLILLVIHRNGHDSFTEGLLAFSTLTALLSLAELAEPLKGIILPIAYASLAFCSASRRTKTTIVLVLSALIVEMALLKAGTRSSLSETLSHIELICLFSFIPLLANPIFKKKRQRLPTGRTDRLDVVSDKEVVLPDVLSDENECLFDSAVKLTQQTLNVDHVSFLLIQNGIESRIESAIIVASTETQMLNTRHEIGSGLIKTVLRSKQPVIANQLTSPIPGTVPVNEGNVPLHLLILPVFCSGQTAGLLLAQRTSGKRFTHNELEHLSLAGQLVSTGLTVQGEVERVMDAHSELERFFKASRLLNSALTPRDVYASTNEALRMIAPFEFTAITWIDKQIRGHHVVHLDGHPLTTHWADKPVHPRSLSSMVMKSGHYLPIGGERRQDIAPVLFEEEDLDKSQSIIVLPLRLHGQIAGTLSVGSEQKGAFTDRRRGMLEVIANQLAVSLANAWAYAKVQELATTDGLTGLFNRRVFQERLSDGLARSQRNGGILSLILLDIDHFKGINDAHGHPIGDEVLRVLSRKIEELLRRTDIAARYGGEEFALILEDTDINGAHIMAERLRIETEKIIFTGENEQPFRITLSLGLASFPMHAKTTTDLVDSADKALYKAKRSGRNQTQISQNNMEDATLALG
jgi:diguanylate cyclase (GGDEF)-like protein